MMTWKSGDEGLACRTWESRFRAVAFPGAPLLVSRFGVSCWGIKVAELGQPHEAYIEYQDAANKERQHAGAAGSEFLFCQPRLQNPISCGKLNMQEGEGVLQKNLLRACLLLCTLDDLIPRTYSLNS